MKKTIQERLFSLQDTNYRAFHCMLIPKTDPETVIGVRIPQLRSLARELAGTEDAAEFLQRLPHTYYEENNLHAFLLESLTDYSETIRALNRFLPFVDNWATCDSITPKCFRKNLSKLRNDIDIWLASDHVYTVRFAVRMLMDYYLGDAFLPSDPEKLTKIQTEEYYLQMMIAWYFATALAKRYADILPYLEDGKLSPKILSMTVRKARESFWLSEVQKLEIAHLAKKSHS